MRTFTITAKETAKSRIICGKGAFGSLPKAIGGREAFVLTDTNVLAIYGEVFDRVFQNCSVYAMPAGEEHKNAETLFTLLEGMAQAGMHRTGVLVAAGGGVVGDLGGLAASLYMRGIPYIQIPTTLLSQADSSVGGKTAIDLCGAKNLVGAFHQPEYVLADPAFLGSLPRREIVCGLGEIVKHGALNAELFEKLCAAPDLFSLGFLADILPESIAVKADVVRRDAKEAGLRKCLNLGHTTAHAVELTSGLSHGACVLWGLMFESRIAVRLFGAEEGYSERLIGLCRAVLGGESIPSVDDVRGALLDKKNTAADAVTLTLPVAAGKYEIAELAYEKYAEELRLIGRELC